MGYNRRRFGLGMDSIGEVLDYYKNRATQMLPKGWEWRGDFIRHDWGINAIFRKEGKEYHTIYIFDSHRRKGHLLKWAEKNPDKTIWTMKECNLSGYLESNEIPFIILNRVEYPEYKLLNKLKRNEYSNVDQDFFMNCIDRSIFLMREMGVKDEQQRAYLGSFVLGTEYEIATQEDIRKISNEVKDALQNKMDYTGEHEAIILAHEAGKRFSKEYALQPLKDRATPTNTRMDLTDKLMDQYGINQQDIFERIKYCTGGDTIWR